MTDPHDRTVHQALIDTYAALNGLMLTVDDDVCTVLGDMMDDLWHNQMGDEDRRIARAAEGGGADDPHYNYALGTYLQRRCDDVMPGTTVCESSSGFLLLRDGYTLIEGTWLELYRCVADAIDHRSRSRTPEPAWSEADIAAFEEAHRKDFDDWLSGVREAALSGCSLPTPPIPCWSLIDFRDGTSRRYATVPAPADDSFEVHAAYLVAEATKILPDADIGVGRTGVVGQYTLDVGDTTVVQGSWLDLYEHVAARRPTVLGERG